MLSALLLAGTAFGQSNLPACQGEHGSRWSNCIGTEKFGNAVYVGEWKSGNRHGQGTETFEDGGKFVGEFKDNRKNGQGTYTHPSGFKYMGEYKDGKENGQGAYTFADGRKREGLWRDDKFIPEAQAKAIIDEEKRVAAATAAAKAAEEQAKINREKEIAKENRKIAEEKRKIAEPFVKEHPFYAQIECSGFQLTGCIDTLKVINGGISKNYGINELMLIAGSGDGITGVDRELYFAFIHLKRNFTIVVQNSTDHPSLRVRVFNKTASGEMNETLFDKTTSRKYEVIRVSK